MPPRGAPTAQCPDSDGDTPEELAAGELLVSLMSLSSLGKALHDVAMCQQQSPSPEEEGKYVKKAQEGMRVRHTRKSREVARCSAP